MIVPFACKVPILNTVSGHSQYFRRLEVSSMLISMSCTVERSSIHSGVAEGAGDGTSEGAIDGVLDGVILGLAVGTLVGMTDG